MSEVTMPTTSATGAITHETRRWIAPSEGASSRVRADVAQQADAAQRVGIQEDIRLPSLIPSPPDPRLEAWFGQAASPDQGAWIPMTNAARLSALLGSFQKLIEDIGIHQLASESSLLKLMATERRQAALDEAQKMARRLEEHAYSAQVAGWLTRAFGWLLTTLSIVVTVFTGGAALAFTAVTLALTVTDQVVQAATGVSPMGTAIQAIIEPIANLMSGLVQKVLEFAGTDPDTARMVAQVLSTVLALAAVVVVAVVGARAAFRVLEPVVSKFCAKVAEVVARNAPNAVGWLADAGQAFGAARLKFAELLAGRIGSESARVAHRLNQFALATQFATVMSSTVGSVVTGTFAWLASRAHADYIQFDNTARTLGQVLSTDLESFAETLEALRALTTISGSALEQERETGRQIMLGMYRAA